MTRPYSLAFKQKMIQRLTGKDALSASQLAQQTGVRQQNLSRWLDEARSLPRVAPAKPLRHKWSLEQKARVLAESAKLTGEQLNAYLEREGVKLADFERWRLALEQDGTESAADDQTDPQARARTGSQGEGARRGGGATGAKKNAGERVPRRGRRHRRAERDLILSAIATARSSGARLAPACRIVGVSARTIERWRTDLAVMIVAVDRIAVRSMPSLRPRKRRS